MELKELHKMLDYLHDLFPVPNHNHFEMLPPEEQHRIIGQGEVMIELVKYIDEHGN